MPELPEVETVKNTLKKLVLNKTIRNTKVLYDGIIATNKKDFINNTKNQTIIDITRRGKWLIFELNDYYLLSHLRMEGRYYLKDKTDPVLKHEHVIFEFDNDTLRYIDTRKFGKMHLIKKEDLNKTEPLSSLGLEPFSELLTKEYLKDKLKNKKIAIKTSLLDQSIIVGIGNIYVDEILFLSRIHPQKSSNTLTKKELENIIKFTKEVLTNAIKQGGTTIKSYEATEGVHGLFQHHLLVHTKEICPVCNTKLIKIRVNGRGTYYCPNCQKEK